MGEPSGRALGLNNDKTLLHAIKLFLCRIKKTRRRIKRIQIKKGFNIVRLQCVRSWSSKC